MSSAILPFKCQSTDSEGVLLKAEIRSPPASKLITIRNDGVLCVCSRDWFDWIERLALLPWCRMSSSDVHGNAKELHEIRVIELTHGKHFMAELTEAVDCGRVGDGDLASFLFDSASETSESASPCHTTNRAVEGEGVRESNQR